jgi:uncharacterized protein
VIRIEIVYAQPQRSIAKSLTLSPGASIADALKLAAVQEDFQAVDLVNATVGVFGQVANRDRPLQDGDRVEIYRPLLEEPKLARRKRVSKSGRS